jgi:hypothetical protein
MLYGLANSSLATGKLVVSKGHGEQMTEQMGTGVFAQTRHNVLEKFSKNIHSTRQFL